MNKTDLIDVVAEETGKSKKDVTAILSAAIDAIRIAVGAGDKVALDGFGAFERVHRAARTARNPRTGDRIQVAAKLVPQFTPYGEFKGLVADGGQASKVTVAA